MNDQHQWLEHDESMQPRSTMRRSLLRGLASIPVLGALSAVVSSGPVDAKAKGDDKASKPKKGGVYNLRNAHKIT
jgi:hypothetical protein